MKQILLKNVILFMAVCGLFSCQEYEIGEVPTTKAATETYEGTLYAYLADKDAHPQVTFDSLLFFDRQSSRIERFFGTSCADDGVCHSGSLL